MNSKDNPYFLMGAMLGEKSGEVTDLRRRIEELEAKIRTYEQRDGMDGAVVSAIRDLLNHHNVPKAAFIDDHVGNAIWQRNVAEANLARVIAAYRIEAMRRDDYSHDAFDQHIAALKGQEDE